MALRKLLISLDDLVAVVQEFLNPDVSRSDLDRCLRTASGWAICGNSKQTHPGTAASRPTNPDTSIWT